MKFTISDSQFVELSRNLLASHNAAMSAAEIMLQMAERLAKTHTILAKVITGGPGHEADDPDAYLAACFVVEENEKWFSRMNKPPKKLGG